MYTPSSGDAAYSMQVAKATTIATWARTWRVSPRRRGRSPTQVSSPRPRCCRDGGVLVGRSTSAIQAATAPNTGRSLQAALPEGLHGVHRSGVRRPAHPVRPDGWYHGPTPSRAPSRHPGRVCAGDQRGFSARFGAPTLAHAAACPGDPPGLRHRADASARFYGARTAPGRGTSHLALAPRRARSAAARTRGPRGPGRCRAASRTRRARGAAARRGRPRAAGPPTAGP